MNLLPCHDFVFKLMSLFREIKLKIIPAVQADHRVMNHGHLPLRKGIGKRCDFEDVVGRLVTDGGPWGHVCD